MRREVSSHQTTPIAGDEFSVDHPYQSMAEGRAFLEQLPVSAADKDRMAHGNAEKLFKL